MRTLVFVLVASCAALFLHEERAHSASAAGSSWSFHGKVTKLIAKFIVKIAKEGDPVCMKFGDQDPDWPAISMAEEDLVDRYVDFQNELLDELDVMAKAGALRRLTLTPWIVKTMLAFQSCSLDNPDIPNGSPLWRAITHGDGDGDEYSMTSFFAAVQKKTAAMGELLPPAALKALQGIHNNECTAKFCARVHSGSEWLDEDTADGCALSALMSDADAAALRAHANEVVVLDSDVKERMYGLAARVCPKQEQVLLELDAAAGVSGIHRHNRHHKKHHRHHTNHHPVVIHHHPAVIHTNHHPAVIHHHHHVDNDLTTNVVFVLFELVINLVILGLSAAFS